MNDIELTSEHIKAVNRQRRIIFQDDVLANQPFRIEPVSSKLLNHAIDFYMSRLDEKPNQIDSVWFEWGEGNTAVWPSNILPRTKNVFPKWWETGIDPIQVLLEETRKRGREVFFSYRINGSDNDPMFDPPHPMDKPIPMKAEHPDWLIQLWHSFWNFAVKEVRDLKVNILREVAEMYDFDGISIDFARVPALFEQEHQWENRDFLTDFIREVRLMLLEVEKQRGRPFLLAARVPENIMGCHFDGMEVERWAREKLVDIFVLGCRSSDVDIAAFRRITAGTGIKLYPCWDEHHSSDGYHEAPIEVYRGVYANWWGQEADGVHTFNLTHSSSSDRWEVQCQIYREIGSPETLKYKDKVFYVQRRGGGHGPNVVPNPDDWSTPRHMYFNTNMFAPLPATLANDGKTDTLFTLTAADDVNATADKIEEITFRMLLSDSTTKDLLQTERLEQAVIEGFMNHKNIPPAIGIEEFIEVRVNNILLAPAKVEGGWLVFTVQPQQLTVGDNLVGVKVTKRPPDVRDKIIIEKLELHINYR